MKGEDPVMQCVSVTGLIMLSTRDEPGESSSIIRCCCVYSLFLSKAPTALVQAGLARELVQLLANDDELVRHAGISAISACVLSRTSPLTTYVLLYATLQKQGNYEQHSWKHHSLPLCSMS